jgi:hypothetical protein
MRHRVDAEGAVAVFVQLGARGVEDGLAYAGAAAAVRGLRRWYSLRAHVPAFYRDTVAFVIGQAHDGLTNATR